MLQKLDAYWRAANYLSVGQIYLYDNPLLRRPLELSDVKPLVVGHWGTTPGQNFIYVHLNRVIKKYDLDMFYVAGPGHGGPALVGNTNAVTPMAPPPPPPAARCLVPRVIGMSLGRARTRIRRANCSVGSVRRTRSRRVAE
jgi:hypothetical protein